MRRLGRLLVHVDARHAHIKHFQSPRLARLPCSGIEPALKGLRQAMCIGQ